MPPTNSVREPGAAASARQCVQIVVPVRDEGENVATLHRRLADEEIAFDSLKFVFDSPADTTVPVIERLKRQDPRVCGELNRNGPGIVQAFRWIFAHCSEGPVLVLMGDNSDKLSLIPEMLRLWNEGALIVAPSRYMAGGEQHGGGFVKSTLSRWGGRSLRLLGFPLSDPTNNFKLYDGAWVRTQEIESRGGFEVALELSHKAFREGLALAELPTVWTDRTYGRSRFRLLGWLPHYLRWYLVAAAESVRRRFARSGAGRRAT